MSAKFSPNRTSGRLLLDYANNKWADIKSADGELRLLMIQDLFVKMRSYSIMNKVFFWISLFSGFLVISWPSITIISKDIGFDKEFLKSAIVQTTITGLAALSFAIYNYYKKRQMYMENLMRLVIFSTIPNESLLEKVLREMERIDSGFAFSQSIMKKEIGKNESL